jgi:hypothetical protein
MSTYGSISAPEVEVEHHNSVITRFYAGAAPRNIKPSVPQNHQSLYGLIWTTPGRAAARYHRTAAPGVAPPATIDFEGQLAHQLAAHTGVLKPLYPDVAPPPDDELLKPRTQRDRGKVWHTEGGSNGGEPGSSSDWVEKSVPAWNSQNTYVEGDVVWYDGHPWIAGPNPTGEPGIDLSWSRVPPWEEGFNYPPGSTVTHGRTPGTGGGGGDDRFFVGRPSGGDIQQIFMRGTAWDTTHNVLWCMDANNSIVIQVPVFGMWYDHSNLNPNGHPSIESTSDWGYWQMRDITYDGTYLWCLRRSDTMLLKYQLPFFGFLNQPTILEAVPLSTVVPSGLAWDGVNFWVNSQADTRLELLTRAGLVEETISHDKTTSTFAGMGYDNEDGQAGVWIADPGLFRLAEIDPRTGQVLRSRGWDADHQAPQSVTRQPGSPYLWVVSGNWVHRFRLLDEPEILDELPFPLRLFQRDDAIYNPGEALPQPRHNEWATTRQHSIRTGPNTYW